MTLNELREMLGFENPLAIGRWEKISRETGMYTVALFAASDSPKGEVLELAGTGTLITVDDYHYILTAAHVWEECLKRAERLGLSLREIDDHKCFIETRACSH